ncbi:MAG: multiheme c-type cytochrome [Planctomycetota bacterium]
MRPLLAAIVLLLSACTGAPTGVGPDLFVSGSIRGYLEPCGCHRPQLGGLPRRGTALADAPFVENGDLVDGPGRLNEIRFETLLTALDDLGCRALNVGPGELALGIDFLRSARGLARFPLISANARIDGEFAFPAGTTVAAGGRTWWVAGLVEHPGAASLAEGVARIRHERPASAQSVLLLFAGGRERAASLAGVADLVVYSAVEPRIDAPALATPGDRGRRLLRIGRDGPTLLTLDESFADDAGMTARIREYVDRIADEDLLMKMNPQVEPEAGGYIGDDACLACHADADSHRGERHARAIESLARTGREIDPTCIGCHVTGWGERTGYLDRETTPDLGHVGCESCHGPGRDHVDVGGDLETPGDARKACFRCHTPDNDPGFDFTKNWRRLAAE